MNIYEATCGNFWAFHQQLAILSCVSMGLVIWTEANNRRFVTKVKEELTLAAVGQRSEENEEGETVATGTNRYFIMQTIIYINTYERMWLTSFTFIAEG